MGTAHQFASERMWSQRTIQLIGAACDEDLDRAGDITSQLLGEPDVCVTARVVPRADGVICGLALGPHVCKVFGERLGTSLALAPVGGGPVADGKWVKAGEIVATVRGPRGAVLTTERTLLNFLGRMSGVATLTRRYVEAARQVNPDVEILDTRKTIPGWRELDKYAVRMGGGTNHRLGLYDAVLIKDNHLAGVPTAHLASTLVEMLSRLPTQKVGGEQGSEPGARATGPAPPRQQSPRLRSGLGLPAMPKFVQVEVDGLEQLAEVCKVPGVDVVLLDNLPPDEMRKAVEYRDSQGLRGKLALETSGRVTLETIAEIAATGVDRVSIGALTHSAASLDIGLDL